MEMFEKEKDLVEAFNLHTKKILKEILNRTVSRHFIIEEFDSHLGVADIVFGTYKPYLSKKSLRSPVNKNWIFPLTTFQLNEAVTLEQFCNKFGLSKNSANLRLNEYCEASFLRKDSKDTFTVVKKYEYVADSVIAVEAKLKNWKRALIQAQRYKKFSDFSFVLLDEHHSSSALSNLGLFDESNIGLITMNDSGYRIHHIPKKLNIKKEDYFVRLNETAYSYFATGLMT